MSIRWGVVLVVVAAMAAWGWQQRERFWTRAVPEPAPVDTRPTSPAPDDGPAPRNVGAADGFRPGQMRKCVKGAQVSYTNVDCPPGFRAQAVGGAPVNVLPATQVASSSQGASAPAALRQALDIDRGETLNDKLIDRATGATR